MIAAMQASLKSEDESDDDDGDSSESSLESDEEPVSSMQVKKKTSGASYKEAKSKLSGPLCSGALSNPLEDADEEYKD